MAWTPIQLLLTHPARQRLPCESLDISIRVFDIVDRLTPANYLLRRHGLFS